MFFMRVGVGGWTMPFFVVSKTQERGSGLGGTEKVAHPFCCYSLPSSCVIWSRRSQVNRRVKQLFQTHLPLRPVYEVSFIYFYCGKVYITWNLHFNHSEVYSPVTLRTFTTLCPHHHHLLLELLLTLNGNPISSGTHFLSPPASRSH